MWIKGIFTHVPKTSQIYVKNFKNPKMFIKKIE